MVATTILCCALQGKTGQGGAGPIAGGICNAGQEDCMTCDAVGDMVGDSSVLLAAKR